MFDGIIDKIKDFFNFKKAAEEKAQKLNEKRLARLEQQNRENDKIAIEEAKKKLSKISAEKKRKADIPYKEFKTVLEMVYVKEKGKRSKKSWTSEQQKEFNKRFEANLKKCQKNPSFQREYTLYIKIENNEVHPQNNPQTAKERAINDMHGAILDIQLALCPDLPDNERYKAIRFKYEKKLDDNKKESEMESTINARGKRTISI